MRNSWNELARRARTVRRPEAEMPFGFDSAVLRRLQAAPRENLLDVSLSLLRPALGLAFATAVLCVVLRVQAEPEPAPNLLVETENLIQFAVLK